MLLNYGHNRLSCVRICWIEMLLFLRMFFHVFNHFLRVSITQKWQNISIPKSVAGEPIAIVVDPRIDNEMSFETGEI